MAVNPADYRISAFFNHLCHKNELFDRAVSMVSDNHLFKGGILVMMIWYLWFKNTNAVLNRLYIISTICGSFIAIFIGRMIPHFTHYRARPILDPQNNFVEAYGINKATFDNLSSFPSDHSALFFSLATGIFLVSKRWGTAAFLCVVCLIAFPRLYLGLHYFTDILCGAVIGIAIVLITNMNFFRKRISARILHYSTTYPPAFYSLFFFITFEIAEMFNSVRNICSFIIQHV
jgi:undecaprenyl-diphosphatase